VAEELRIIRGDKLADLILQGRLIEHYYSSQGFLLEDDVLSEEERFLSTDTLLLEDEEILLEKLFDRLKAVLRDKLKSITKIVGQLGGKPLQKVKELGRKAIDALKNSMRRHGMGDELADKIIKHVESRGKTPTVIASVLMALANAMKSKAGRSAIKDADFSMINDLIDQAEEVTVEPVSEPPPTEPAPDDFGNLTYVDLWNNIINPVNFSSKMRQYATQPIDITDVKFTAYPKDNQLKCTCVARSESEREGRKYDPVVIFSSVEYADDDNPNNLTFMATNNETYNVYPIKMRSSYVKARCTCLDFYYRFALWNWQAGAIYGDKPKPYTRVPGSNRGPVNPNKVPGVCKHIIKFVEELQNNGLVKQ